MTNQIISDKESVIVQPGQEYRILAYDRQNETHCFINQYVRTQTIHTYLLGEHLVTPRYECIQAYVFPIGIKYPGPTSVLIEEISKWAKMNCIEERDLPIWWQLEIFDTICGMNCDQVYEKPTTFYCDKYNHPDFYRNYSQSLYERRVNNQELEYYI